MWEHCGQQEFVIGSPQEILFAVSFSPIFSPDQPGQSCIIAECYDASHHHLRKMIIIRVVTPWRGKTRHLCHSRDILHTITRAAPTRFIFLKGVGNFYSRWCSHQCSAKVRRKKGFIYNLSQRPRACQQRSAFLCSYQDARQVCWYFDEGPV